MVDEDYDAAAQAVHSSGFAVSIFRLRDAAGRPSWVAEPAKHYERIEQRLLRELGAAAFAAFLTTRCAEALKLWRELGYRDGETGRPAPRPEPPPCKLISWRSQWTVTEASGGAAQATHRSGFAFNLVYGEAGKGGPLSWRAVLPLHLQTRAASLRAEIGDEAFEAYMGRLVQECELLWAERGYSDASPHRSTAGGAGQRDG